MSLSLIIPSRPTLPPQTNRRAAPCPMPDATRRGSSGGGKKNTLEDASVEFSFENIMKNRSLPPCSLNDFMDYLLYVEHTAENLQFFLWYCAYIERWSKLLPRQKLMSPEWDPARNATAQGLRISIHKRSDSEKLAKILAIMERGPRSKRAVQEEDTAQTPATDDSPCGVETPHDWQPYTIQPFRDEVTKVVRHYIAEGSPRQLDLFPQERNACFNALQTTTHPSTLLPAFSAAETALRTQSHPKFAKWSLQNANRHRLVFLQLMTGLVILLSLALDIVFILSGQNRFFRLLCFAFWWPALTILFSSVKGICVFLHCKGLRTLRPWEQFPDAEVPEDDNASIRSFGKADDVEMSRLSVDSTRRPTFSRIDPLRKASLQAFGPKNAAREESWVQTYGRQSLFRKIFEPTMAAGNKHLRLRQDRVVFKAVLYAGLVAAVLTVVSIFVPTVKLF